MRIKKWAGKLWMRWSIHYSGLNGTTVSASPSENLLQCWSGPNTIGSYDQVWCSEIQNQPTALWSSLSVNWVIGSPSLNRTPLITSASNLNPLSLRHFSWALRPNLSCCLTVEIKNTWHFVIIRQKIFLSNEWPRQNEKLVKTETTEGVSVCQMPLQSFVYYRLLSGVLFTRSHSCPGCEVGGRGLLSGTVAQLSFFPPRGPTSWYIPPSFPVFWPGFFVMVIISLWKNFDCKERGVYEVTPLLVLNAGL